MANTKNVLVRLSGRSYRDFFLNVPEDWDEDRIAEEFWNYSVDCGKDAGSGINDQEVSVENDDFGNVPSLYYPHVLTEREHGA